MNLAYSDIILDQGLGARFKWFIVLSLIFHGALLYFGLAVLPKLNSGIRHKPPIYTVSLMAMPAGPQVPSKKKTPAPPKPVESAPVTLPEEAAAPEPVTEATVPPEPEPAELVPLGPLETQPEPEIKKIEPPPPKPKPKAEVKPKPKPKPKAKAKPKKKPNPDKLIAKRLAEIKKRKQEEARVQQAIDSVAQKRGSGEGVQGGVRGSGPSTEMDSRMRDYYVVLTRIISSNWAMPARLDKKKKYKAVFIIRIDRSGRVSKGWFEQKAKDKLFDQFVELAVDRSRLPPLPEVFTGDYVEVGLVFTPSGVKSN